MNKKIQYIVLLCLTAALLGVIVCSMLITQPSFQVFSVEIRYEGEKQVISCWENEENELYVFLPSGVRPENAYLIKRTGEAVLVNGQLAADQIPCSEFEPGKPYEITYTAFGERECKSLIVVQSEGLPALFVATDSGSKEYLHGNKENKESGTMTAYTADGKLDYRGAVDSISARGNYTWYYSDKKGYGLSLAQEADVIGMGAAQNWILLANAADDTHMRNQIVFDFADAAGLNHSADLQWTTLYLNGEYVGLYQLAERNEVHESRVNIAKQNSFLVSLELEERLAGRNVPYIKTDSDQTLRIHYPDMPSELDMGVLSDIWQTAENAILAPDGIDPVSGKHYAELIDVDSWARKYLIEEIFGNLDACFLSQYFYYDGAGEDGRIYAGPVWDYDLTMGNPLEWQLTNPQSLFARRLEVKDGLRAPMFYELCRKDEFWSCVVELYRTEFLPLLEALQEDGIAQYARQISQPVSVDRIRWPEHIVDEYNWQIDALTNYLNARISFLNSYFLDQTQYHIVHISSGLNGNDAYWAVSPGQRLPQLPELEGSTVLIGWYDAKTDEPFDPNLPIFEDMAIYAKWEESDSSNLKQILKLAPLGVIAALGLILVAIEFYRWRKYG